MTRLIVTVAAALVALSAPSGAPAMPMDQAMQTGPQTPVSIAYAAYRPQRVVVLPGEAVAWTNVSVRVHTVTGMDDRWSSGRIGIGDGFAHRFDAAGSYAYYCRLHPSIRGVVDVHELILDAPRQPAGPGRPFPLTGRTSLQEGTQVSIEADEGAGFEAAATATVGAGGAFSASFAPRGPARYRALAGKLTSDPVQLLVLDRRVGATIEQGRRRVIVRAHVTPASPGATVVLQLRLRDRFGWWPVHRTRLDSASRARFTVPIGHAVPARVQLTLPDGATALAVSRTLAAQPGHPGGLHHHGSP